MTNDNLHILYIAIIALYLVTSLLFLVLFLMMFKIKKEFIDSIQFISKSLNELLIIKQK